MKGFGKDLAQVRHAAADAATEIEDGIDRAGQLLHQFDFVTGEMTAVAVEEVRLGGEDRLVLPGILSRTGGGRSGKAPKKITRATKGPLHLNNKEQSLPSAHPWGAMMAAVAAMASAAGAGARSRTWLGRQQAFALHLLSRELAGPTDCFRLFPRLLFRWFFVMAAELHLAENALALHLLFERLEGLVDIVVANENLHACSFVDVPTG